MKIKCQLSTVFHFQTNDQTEHQNQTLKHYLHCYCNEEQDNWVSLLSLVKFAYINAKQATLECSLFYVMMNYNVSIHYDVENNTWKKEIFTAKNKVKKLNKTQKALSKWWKNAVILQTKIYNKKHEPKTYNEKDLVLLSTKNLSQKHSHKKLLHKFIESFWVYNIVEKQAYCLYLFIFYKIHNVFYVLYLKLYVWWKDDSKISKLSLSEFMNETEEYKVKEILNKQQKKDELWYKIRWKNYSLKYNQWIQKRDMKNAQELWQQFDMKT